MIYRWLERLSGLNSDMKYGIKNLIKWLPVIWKDRDWDEAFLYQIMYKKVTEMEKFFRSDNAYAVDGRQKASEMKVVKVALKRLIDNIYYEEACAVLDVNPDRYSEEGYELAQKLAETDIERVFSNKVSSQIQGWWD